MDVKSLHVKYPLFLWDFNKTWIFSTDFQKKLKNQISSKSTQWEPSFSMRADGHEVNSHFSPILRTRLKTASLNNIRVIESQQMILVEPYSMQGRCDADCIQKFCVEPEEKRPLGGPRRRWEEYIKMHLTNI
jgi:hypothetical protein